MTHMLSVPESEMPGKKQSVFMIGWEYPPHNSGGLGVACKGLTEALAQTDTDLHFSLPYSQTLDISHMKVHHCVHQNWEAVDSDGNVIFTQSVDQYLPGVTAPPFFAYSSEYTWHLDSSVVHSIDGTPVPIENVGYSFDLSKLHKQSSSQLEKQVSEYAEVVGGVGATHKDSFEVIHAHDWMSFPAAQELKKRTGKPLVTHVHSTEYDRAGLNQGNRFISEVEYEGMHRADHVIAVSYYTKRLLEQKYGVDSNKITVVHNGVEKLREAPNPGTEHFAPKRPVIAFMGRLTIQKGVSYFLDLAHAVLQKIPNALFVVAGNGDMYHELLLKTAASGISASVVFSGFVRDSQRKKLLDRADVFVMPSVSEPFGLVALEAAQHHTPVIVSKNAGVSEVLPHAIALDFWDIDQMTESIADIISDDDVSSQMVAGQLNDIAKQTWKSSAEKIASVYKKAFLGNKP